MKPSEQCNPLTRKVHREVTQLLEASSGRDARLDRKVNTGESRFSPRYSEQAKDADRLGPKGA
ncbi:hypothetical protein QPK13_11350 [Photorhabdus tasmaniensis]|uniref:hypothetical protein n=1 Tax=Photorhabdus tasmaniensis TaxID=1004159 RepID=UPI001061E8C3|nr:hypothetical protein [Photorhabdus tasmaniensis]